MALKAGLIKIMACEGMRLAPFVRAQIAWMGQGTRGVTSVTSLWGPAEKVIRPHIQAGVTEAPSGGDEGTSRVRAVYRHR